MKILIIARRFPVISQTFVQLHVESLLKLGHEVTVMADRGDSSLLAVADINGIKINQLIPNTYPCGSAVKRIFNLVRQIPWQFRSCKLLASVIVDYVCGRSAGAALSAIPYANAMRRTGQWDIVHVHFGNLALPVAQLCEAGFINAPVVVTFHGTDLNAKKRVPISQLYARVFQAAQLLTVGTKHMAKHLEECDIPPEKYKIVPMGIDLSRFKRSLAQSVGANSGTRLITTGRLVEVKGIEYAIRAVAVLSKTWPNITLDIIGDGPLRNDLGILCKQLNIDLAVKFHGALEHDKLLALLQRSDIYVQPGIVAADGTREGQGVAVAEAQAAGLPVVASRVGGIPEVVAEGESAFLVEPKDVCALANQISVLIRDPELRNRMGAAGKVFVEKTLDQEALAKRWTTIYNGLIDALPHNGINCRQSLNSPPAIASSSEIE